MTRSLLSLAAGSLLLALAGPAWAGHGHGSGYPGGMMHHSTMSHSMPYHNVYSASYHTLHGTKFSHGYYFRGRNQRFWTSSGWSRRYGCSLYWYPGTSSWYYWCAPQNCYFPLSYIGIAPPVAAPGPYASAPGAVPPIP